MKTIADRKAQLQVRRKELALRGKDLEAELESHTEKDWEDRAIQTEGDEVLEGMGAAAADEIARIDAALERIEAEEYGLCVRCGKEISEERLDLLPDTPFCRACA